jgi:hypothetical protein
MRDIKDFMKLLENAGRDDPLGVVEEIRGHEMLFNIQTGSNNPSYFHLHPCVRCHSPVWCQPCPVCDYYPMGGHDGQYIINSPAWLEWVEKDIRPKAKERFIQLVNRHGNIGVWYFSNKKKLVAYNENSDFKKQVDHFIEQLKRYHFPSAEEIWDAYGE